MLSYACVVQCSSLSCKYLARNGLILLKFWINAATWVKVEHCVFLKCVLIVPTKNCQCVQLEAKSAKLDIS